MFPLGLKIPRRAFFSFLSAAALRPSAASSPLFFPRFFSSRRSIASAPSSVFLNGVPLSPDGSFPLPYALRLLLALRSGSPFPNGETVEICVNLNLDPRKPNQSVKGVVALPHGTGKKVRVAVFAKGAKADEARAAGADLVGDSELVEAIQAGKIDFDRLIATPDMMAAVGRVARILGPRGLMPNPKMGTVTNDLAVAIKSAKAGQVQFKTDKFGIIHAPVGRTTFSTAQLEENVSTLVSAVHQYKPIGAKGKYYKSAFIAATQGGSVKLNINSAPFKIERSKQANNNSAGSNKENNSRPEASQ